EYYDRMTGVRRKGNYEQWINFCLQAVMESAEDAIHTIDQLTALPDKNRVLLQGRVARRQDATLQRQLAELGGAPLIQIKNPSQAIDVAYNTVARAGAVLDGKGILKQSEQAGKTRIYAYSEYLDILRKDT